MLLADQTQFDTAYRLQTTFSLNTSQSEFNGMRWCD